MEEGWIEYEDACYVYVDKLYTFEQARSYCHGYIGGTADLVFNMNSNANSFTYNLVGNKTTFKIAGKLWICLLYTSPSPRDATLSRMPSSA